MSVGEGELEGLHSQASLGGLCRRGQGTRQRVGRVRNKPVVILGMPPRYARCIATREVTVVCPTSPPDSMIRFFALWHLVWNIGGCRGIVSGKQPWKDSNPEGMDIQPGANSFISSKKPQPLHG